MASKATKLLLVTLVIMASFSDTLATCRILGLKFRLFGCARRSNLLCRIVDFKMRILFCKQFGCEGYRDVETYCTYICRQLEIKNGICPIGQKCCLKYRLNATAVDDEDDDLRRIPGSDAYDLISPEYGTYYDGDDADY